MADKSLFSSGARRQKIKGKTVTLTISLSEEQLSLLRKNSEYTKRSISSTVCSLLDFKKLKKQNHDLKTKYKAEIDE
jgi:hypothetical protein